MIFYLILSFLGCRVNITPYKVHVRRVRQHQQVVRGPQAMVCIKSSTSPTMLWTTLVSSAV